MNPKSKPFQGKRLSTWLTWLVICAQIFALISTAGVSTVQPTPQMAQATAQQAGLAGTPMVWFANAIAYLTATSQWLWDAPATARASALTTLSPFPSNQFITTVHPQENMVVNDSSEAALTLLAKRGTHNGPPAGGNGPITVDWVIDYRNTTGAIQTNVVLEDTLGPGQTMVSDTLELPSGWTATQVDVDTIRFSNPLVAPLANGVAKTINIPLSGAVTQVGGDGFNPVFLTDGRIVAVNHVRTNATIYCYDPVARGDCTGYPRSSGFGGHQSPETAAVGNRIYVNGSLSPSWGTTGVIYCWNFDTNSRCQDSPTIGQFTGPYLLNGKLYVVRNDGQLQCYDPAANLASCAGFTPTNLGVTFAAGTGSADMITDHAAMLSVGTWLYIASSKINCFDTSTNTFCSGWSSTGIANPQGSHYLLYPRRNAAGVTTGICVGATTCFDLNGANSQNVSTGIPMVVNYSATYKVTTLGSRLFYADAWSASGLFCWDWATNAACTGTNWTGGAISAGRPYGINHDGVCVYTVGHDLQLMSFDPQTGATPCLRSGATTTIELDSFYACGTGLPADVAWHQVTLHDVNLTSGTEFSELTVIVRNSVDGTILVGPLNALNTTGVFDISTISSSITNLQLEVNGLPVGTAPYNDGIIPKVSLTYSSTAPAQFCYQTTVNANCSSGSQSISNSVTLVGTTDSATATVNVCQVPNSDSDGDGVPNNTDLDDDNDGIPDTIEGNGTVDTDGDTIPDSLDLDTDNDSILDVIEAGHDKADANGDGMVDGAAGANGLPDAVETVAESGTINYTIRNTDGDAVGDWRDLDSDNDSLNDVVENNGTDANGDGLADGTDPDGDGIRSSADASATWGDSANPAPPDTDGDTLPDYRDLDSDNDSVNDVRENNGTDANNDGLADGADPDGDGINATADGSPTWADANNPAPPNTDGDAVPDFRDLDSDDDGLDDVVENNGVDANGDGLADGTDPDNDGIRSSADGAPATFGDASDPAEPDSDSNGTPDRKQPNGPVITGPDSDNDGIKNSVDGAPNTFGDAPDNDKDGVPDATDIDDDNDGILDTVENAGSAGSPTNDSDLDGQPDRIDIDADNDGIPDNVEAQPSVGYVPPSGVDSDGDGLDNAYEGSGNAGLTPVNTDNTDARPDYLDLDSDSDGVPDIQENGMPTHVVSGVDTDGDGLDNAFEGSNLNDPTDVNDEINNPLSSILPDADGDKAGGVPLAQDLDYRDALAPTLKSTLGDFIWFDSDGDGLKDAGEPGINGVRVNLADASGFITFTVTANDTGSVGDDTGVTQGPGFYRFTVNPGQVYTVTLDASNFAPGGALRNLTYTGNLGGQAYSGAMPRVVIMPAGQSDEQDVDFSYTANPTIAVSKVATTPGASAGVRKGDPIAFTIHITNTGVFTIVTLPLADFYSTVFLTYAPAPGANPAPVDNVNDGQLNWSNLAPAGGLAPGQSVVVTVPFIVANDTTLLVNQSPCVGNGFTCNVGRVVGALADPDGNGPLGPIAPLPPTEGSAPAKVIAPTAAELNDTSVTVQDGQVILRWGTVSEVEAAGFNILRQDLTEPQSSSIAAANLQSVDELLVGAERLNTDLIEAKASGQVQGAEYSFTDTTAQAGKVYRYLLEIVSLDGSRGYRELGMVGGRAIYLPVVRR